MRGSAFGVSLMLLLEVEKAMFAPGARVIAWLPVTLDRFPKASFVVRVTAVQSPAATVSDAGEKASTVGAAGLMVTFWPTERLPCVAVTPTVPAVVPLK